MQLVRQEHGTHICGQCCIAMVTGRLINDVIGDMGKGRTNTKKLMKQLWPKTWETRHGLFRISGPSQLLPDQCIVRIKWMRPDSKGKFHHHWVVHNYGMIYDPAFGIYPYKYIINKRDVPGKMMSYLFIGKIENNETK